jgi:nitrogenase subunit NifH
LTETSGLAAKFAKKLSVPALAFVPDSPDFREAERRNATIFQAFGDNHPLSLIFTSLAKNLSNNEWSSKQVMAPMTDEELNDFYNSYDIAQEEWAWFTRMEDCL